ncbi:MAG: secretin N-terminal domain-containing protein [Syntrophorhabdales bacterium]
MLHIKPALLLLCPLVATLIVTPALRAKAGDLPVFAGLPAGVVVQAEGPAPENPETAPKEQPGGPEHIAPPSPAPPPGMQAPIRGPQASPPPQAGLVQMQFDNIELRDLIRFVSNIMGKNFIYDEAVVKGRVTVLSPKSLTKDEVFRVFESVLNYFGFTVITTPETYKIVRSADAKGMAVQTLDKAALAKLPPEERITTLVYPLGYTDSNTMVGILRPLMSRDAYLVSVPTANSLIMIDTTSNLKRLETLITQVDVPVSRQLSGIEVYNVQHTSAADLAKALQALLAEGKKAQTPKEKIFVTSYAPSNSLLISAPPEDMKEIRRIVDEIDTFRPQVLVEAAIIELSLVKTQTLGVEWLVGGSASGSKIIGGNIISTDATTGGALVPLATGIASNTPATAIGALKSGLNIGVVGSTFTMGGISFPSVQSFVQALAADTRTKVLSTPQLLTLNNEEAEVLVGSNIPYTTSTRLDSAGNPITNFDYRDVGVKLKVKPYINRDGLVYLNIFTEITQVTSTLATVGSGQQTAPTTTKRSTKTTVGVRDSQTIVISGIISDTLNDTGQRVPWLSSIPILGNLFNYSSKSDTRTNLLMFLTPKIIYDPKQLQKISDEQKAQQEKFLGSQGKK